MPRKQHTQLSRRERQIMDALYLLGAATVAAVQKQIPEPQGYSAVRAMLNRLEEKGHVAHKHDGARYVYTPTLPRRSASHSALDRLVSTFFGGSAADAVAALLDKESSQLDEQELDRLAAIIKDARRRGR
jgi:predicted transcriptional regulator